MDAWARSISTQPQAPTGSANRARLVYSANIILCVGQLPATAAVLHTVGINTTEILTSFSVHNTDTGSAHTFTIALYPANVTFTSTPLYAWYSATVPANTVGNFPQVFERSLEEVLSPGYTIVGVADTAGVLNYKFNGLLISSQ